MPRKPSLPEIPWIAWSKTNSVSFKSSMNGVGDGEEKLVAEPKFHGHRGRIMGGQESFDIRFKFRNRSRTVEVKKLTYARGARTPELRFRVSRAGHEPVARMIELFSMLHPLVSGSKFEKDETSWRLKLRHASDIGRAELKRALDDANRMIEHVGSSELRVLYKELVASMKPSSVFRRVDYITFVSEAGFLTVRKFQFNRCLRFEAITQGKLKFKLVELP